MTTQTPDASPSDAAESWHERLKRLVAAKDYPAALALMRSPAPDASPTRSPVVEPGSAAPDNNREWVASWHSASETPQVGVGDDRYFIVAVRRHHSGKTHSFPAIYLNQKPLIFDDDAEIDERPTTGWFSLESDGDEGDKYLPVLRGTDELLAWCDVPQYASPAPVPSGDVAGVYVTLLRNAISEAARRGDTTVYLSKYVAETILSALSPASGGKSYSQAEVDSLLRAAFPGDKDAQQVFPHVTELVEALS